MRDAHRMKEKFDLSLDNRQIVSLVISGIVVLGAVFVLGVVVGKKLGDSAGATNAPDLLSALDAQAAANDRLRSAPAPTLTFQEELVKKSPEPEAAPHKPAPAAPAPPTSKSLAADVAKAAAPTPPKPAPKPADTDAEEVETPAAAADAPSAAINSPTFAFGKIQDVSVAARTAEHEPSVPKPATAPKAVASKSAFSLQLSATQTRDEATKFVTALKVKGYSPYIVEAQVPGRGTWYRVRMGEFPTKEAAGKYLQDFRRETQLDAFIASTAN